MDSSEVGSESEMSRSFQTSPFDKSNQHADLILRSVDGDDFYVHKLLLCLTSHVFATMFTLPQDPSIVVSDSPSVTPLAEDSRSLYLLLTWCDPRCLPSKVLKDIEVVLHLSDKYAMDDVTKRVGGVLELMTDVIETEPLKIFAIATRYHLKEVARIAGRATLRLSLEERPNIPELRLISGYALQNLYDYYVACAKAAALVATDLSWLTNMDFVWSRVETEYHHSGCPYSNCLSLGRNCRNWWLGYMKRAAEELYKRPRGSTVIISPMLAAESLAIAAACASCRPSAYPDLQRFSVIFSKEVEERIDRISLVVE